MAEPAKKLSTVINKARHDAEFLRATRALDFNIGLRITDPDAPFEALLSTQDAPHTLWLQTDAGHWQALMDGRQPGYHSFGAAIRRPGTLEVHGVSGLQQARALYALERFFELLRGQTTATAPAFDEQLLGQIRGQYTTLTLPSGLRTPVYWEHTGNPDGPLLVTLHTAGADSRQFHPLMCAPELVARFQVASLDLPGHGRSLPLAGDLSTDYQLDKSQYLDLCHAFIHHLQGRYPVVDGQPQIILMGCSMGAAMALYYARTYPQDLCAVVALEPPYQARGRLSPYLAHPGVNPATHNAAYVRGLMSPDSPLGYRQLASWIYSQAGYGVYAGDLHFYSEQFDAAEDLAGLSAEALPVLLFSGHYDYSASPADVQQVAQIIPGAKIIDMPDLGHFPMLEHPDIFLHYLLPELEKIRQNTWPQQEE